MRWQDITNISRVFETSWQVTITVTVFVNPLQWPRPLAPPSPPPSDLQLRGGRKKEGVERRIDFWVTLKVRMQPGRCLKMPCQWHKWLRLQSSCLAESEPGLAGCSCTRCNHQRLQKSLDKAPPSPIRNFSLTVTTSVVTTDSGDKVNWREKNVLLTKNWLSEPDRRTFPSLSRFVSSFGASGIRGNFFPCRIRRIHFYWSPRLFWESLWPRLCACADRYWNERSIIGSAEALPIIGSAEALPILCVRYIRWERERDTERERERKTEVTSPLSR